MSAANYNEPLGGALCTTVVNHVFSQGDGLMRTSIGFVVVVLVSFIAMTTSQAAIVLTGTGTVTSASIGTMYDSATDGLVAVPTTSTPVIFTYAISGVDIDPGFGSFLDRGGFSYDSFAITAGSWNVDAGFGGNHLVDNGFSPDQINHSFQTPGLSPTNPIKLSTVAAVTYLDGTLASYPATGLPFDEGFDYSNFLSGGTLRVDDLTTGGNFSFSVDSLQTVPEPSTFAMLAFGAVGVCLLGRRRKRRSSH